MKALLTGFHILYHLSQYSTYFLRKVRYSVSGLELTLKRKTPAQKHYKSPFQPRTDFFYRDLDRSWHEFHKSPLSTCQLTVQRLQPGQLLELQAAARSSLRVEG